MLVDSKNKINYLIKVDCVKIVLRVFIVGGDGMCLIAFLLVAAMIFFMAIDFSNSGFSFGMSFLLATIFVIVILAVMFVVLIFMEDHKNK